MQNMFIFINCFQVGIKKGENERKTDIGVMIRNGKQQEQERSEEEGSFEESADDDNYYAE